MCLTLTSQVNITATLLLPVWRRGNKGWKGSFTHTHLFTCSVWRECRRVYLLPGSPCGAEDNFSFHCALFPWDCCHVSHNSTRKSLDCHAECRWPCDYHTSSGSESWPGTAHCTFVSSNKIQIIVWWDLELKPVHSNEWKKSKTKFGAHIY